MPARRERPTSATTAPMLQEQRRTKDLEARQQSIFDVQRYAAEQQYYVYTTPASTAASAPRCCGWSGNAGTGWVLRSF